MILEIDGVRLDLTAEQADEARRQLGVPTPSDGGLVDASTLARRLGCSRSWIYENAEALGGVRLGSGARPRWRFDPEKAERLAAPAASPPGRDVPSEPASSRRRRGRPRAKGGHDLLPIRGGRGDG